MIEYMPGVLGSIVKDLDPQIERIVMRLLEKDPFRRIREADALAAELSDIALRQLLRTTLAHSSRFLTSRDQQRLPFS